MILKGRLFTSTVEKLLSKSVTSCGNTFNKAGGRVASRGVVSGAENLKLLKAPQDAVSADVLNIEKAFGKEKVQILSFLDKDGKVISRIKKSGDEVVKSTYQNGQYKKNVFEVVREFVIKGKTKNTLRTKIKLGDSENPVCSQMTLKTRLMQYGERAEQQLMRSWTLNDLSTEKHLQTMGVRYKDGGVSLRRISGNVENLEELKKDPYIMIRNYNNRDFAQSLAKIISDRFKINLPQLRFKSSNNFGLNGSYRSIPGFEAVTMNNIETQSHYEIADTVAHELRHKTQDGYSYFKN